MYEVTKFLSSCSALPPPRGRSLHHHARGRGGGAGRARTPPEGGGGGLGRVGERRFVAAGVRRVGVMGLEGGWGVPGGGGWRQCS